VKPESPNYLLLDAFHPETRELNVIVETPKGSRNKFEYDYKTEYCQKLVVYQVYPELDAQNPQVWPRLVLLPLRLTFDSQFPTHDFPAHDSQFPIHLPESRLSACCRLLFARH